mmetsp:Transcript_25361/g.64437  ORF Transcript_25361/g.64437 Transcript_25361/m.64437 type:complete len:200 (-) Transcript_25361:136-735(-)
MRGLSRHISGFGHLWGFDSFVGLPTETQGEPLEGPHWRPGAFSAADAFASYSLDALLERLRQHVGHKNMTLVSGFFNESLTTALSRQYSFQPALLVDVDVDLHASALQCLTWMIRNGLIIPGTLVRYDDWRNMRQRHGEARAHWEVTRNFNITWRNVESPDGTLNSREWQVEAIGKPLPPGRWHLRASARSRRRQRNVG